MAVERLPLSDDLAEENEDMERRYGSGVTSEVFRMSFFTKPFKTRHGLRFASNNDLIGYVIIKNDTVPGNGSVNRVYESVIRPSRHDNNFIKGQQNWACRTGDLVRHIPGYVYAQQNDMTNVCAHVALRTCAARFHPDGDMSYREMNRLVGVDHKKRKAGGSDGEGLTSDEMVSIMEAAGARCFAADYTTTVTPPAPFHKYLYGSIESGFPAIVVFGLASGTDDYHAVPIFGHTFNEDTWVPRAEFSYFRIGPGTQYVPSESWLSMFVAHDDNWGSNYCIPRRYLHTKRSCSQLSRSPQLCPEERGGVAYAISTVPKQVKLSPIRAEVIGADYLFTILPQIPASPTAWDKRLARYANAHMLVLRTILVSGKDYVRHLNSAWDWDYNRIRKDMVQAIAPHLRDEMYWLVELSMPELFSANHRKAGEVLIRAQVEPGHTRDFRNFVFCRLPGYFALYDGGGPSNPRYQFVPSGVQGHVRLFGLPEPA